MGLFTSAQSFNRGEVAPEFADRTDAAFYASAVRRLDNFFPIPAGGITTRPALLTIPDSMAFGGGGFTLAPASASTVVSEVKGGFLWAVFAWVYDTSTPQLYKIQARYGVLARQGGRWAVVGTPATVDVTTAATATALFGTSIVNGVGLPSLANGLTRTTAGPAVFLASRWFAPQRLFLTGAGAADFQPVQFFKELLGTVEIKSGSTTVTGVDTIFDDQLAVGDTVFIDDTSYEVATVTNATEFTTTQAVTGLTLAGLRATVPDPSPFGVGQNPALVTFYKNRLLLLATEEKPTGLWASRPNDPFTILPGSVHDDAPIEVELFADGVDQFRWVTSLNQVFIGTGAGEFAIQVTGEGPLTPTNFSFVRIGTTGGEAVPPVALEGGIVHVARASGQLMINQFDFARQGFTSSDLSLFAPHLLTAAVRAMAHRSPRRKDPAGRFFVVLEDGTVRVFSFNDEQGIQAWSRFTLADAEQQTPVDVSTLTDAAFFLVERDGALVLCVLDEERAGIFEMDYAVVVTPTAPGSKVYDVSAQPMLTNRQVAVFSTGFGFLGVFTATTQLDLSGLGVAVEDVTVGVPYTAEVALLPAVVSTSVGESHNRRKRLVRTILSVRDTFQLEINQRPLLGDVAPVEGGNVPPFTGALEQRHLGWFTQEDTTVSTQGIYPATVLSLTREVGI